MPPSLRYHSSRPPPDAAHVDGLQSLGEQVRALPRKNHRLEGR